jgi:hypothetical protein
VDNDTCGIDYRIERAAEKRCQPSFDIEGKLSHRRHPFPGFHSGPCSSQGSPRFVRHQAPSVLGDQRLQRGAGKEPINAGQGATWILSLMKVYAGGVLFIFHQPSAWVDQQESAP